MKRYQESNRIERIFRSRWLLTVPFIFIFKYVRGVKVYLDEIINDKLTHTDKYEFASCKLMWRIAHSEATMKMKWYYTSDEVMSEIKKRKKKKK